jgi:hypothetical protein
MVDQGELIIEYKFEDLEKHYKFEVLDVILNILNL